MNITLYGATWCAFCKTEKQWLDSKNIKYDYKEVDIDDVSMKELMSLDVGSSIPVTVIDNGVGNPLIIRGFDRQSIGSAIGI